MVLDEGGIAAINIGVILGPHISAASPRFIADCEVRNLPRLFAPVTTTQVGPLGVSIGGHVLDPLHHLLWRAAADVAINVCVGSEHLAQIEELMRAEGVRVDTAPARVGTSRTLVARTDAVTP